MLQSKYGMVTVPDRALLGFWRAEGEEEAAKRKALRLVIQGKGT